MSAKRKYSIALMKKHLVILVSVIAGFTLACTGIAYQLIWRQVRNIGGEAPTM